MTTLALTVLTVLVAVALWFIVKDSPEELAGRDTQQIMPSEHGRVGISWFRVVRETLSIRAVQCTLVSLSLSYGALMAFQGLWGVRFLMDLYGLDRTAASNLIMVLPMGIIISSLLLSKAFDTRAGRAVYIGGYLTGTIVYSILSLSPGGLSTFTLPTCLFLVGFTQVVFPYALRVYSQVLPQKHFGSAMGFVNALPFLGGVVFQPLTGYVFDLFGGVQGPLPLTAYRYFFLLLAGASVAATVTAFWTRAEV
jgi:hypothetical protein